MPEWDAKTAEWYADKYGEYATNRLAIDELELSSTAVVVDVGCGTGAALRHASKTVRDGRLIGVDPIPRMVEIAREGCADYSIELIEAPASAIPLDDALADWVLAFDSFDHWDDKMAGLAEAKRILSGTGRFAVVKDGGVPGDRETFAASARQAGFELESEQSVENDGVSFRLWVFRTS